MSTLSANSTGIFTADATGQVKINYLYDGGKNVGELAIFSLQGMESLTPGSAAFIQEAARRAASNSTSGYIVVKDSVDRARFSGTLPWEGNFNGGEYRGEQTFTLKANSTFAMMLVSQGSIASLITNPTSTTNPALFSFGSFNTASGTITQIADITGKGDTFGWEDVKNLQTSDRDYNDLVVQVVGATTNAPVMESVAYANRDWRTTSFGQELVSYANRIQLDRGIFEVNSTGRIKVDYLFDGGWFQGEMAVFSLDGMESYQVGSESFVKEAARRALSNSESGRILLRDVKEGALFSAALDWEKNYNSGAYRGEKSFEMKPGDRLAFLAVPNNTIESLYYNPDPKGIAGNTPLFSIPVTDSQGNTYRQFAAIDERGTIGMEDIYTNSANPNPDFNDLVFQVQGLTGNLDSIQTLPNANSDWLDTATGLNLLAYTARSTYSSGVFEVGETGQVSMDFLFDGGWFQGELALFSIEGMETYTPGSTAYIQEAARRSISDTPMGRVLVRDRTEGARYTQALSWENNFNSGTYQNVRNVTLTPGKSYAFMLVQNTTAREIANNPSVINQWGKLPIFSVPEINPGGIPVHQFVSVDKNGTFAFEDVRVDGGGSDKDYNDIIFQVKGATGTASSIDLAFNPDRDWRKTETGQSLLTYANRPVFDRGVFVVPGSGQVTIDYLYDGGRRQGEIGIFSLKGMESYQIGTQEFTNEAIRRALSNSRQGFLVVNDSIDGARFRHTEEITWEGDFNGGTYRGEQTYLMNPGETFGMVYTPENSLGDELLNPEAIAPERLFFSMPAANLDRTVQMAKVFSSSAGTILTLEDVHLEHGSNKDYNDIVIAIKGVQSAGFSDLEDVIRGDRLWQDTAVGRSILDVFNQPAVV